MEPGLLSTYFVNKAGQVKIEVQILGPQGAPDRRSTWSTAPRGCSSITDRLTTSAFVGGVATAEYLSERTGMGQ